LLNCSFFQEKYDTLLHERYNNNHSTYLELDPNLWLEVGSLGKPDRNQVYDISTTRTEDMRMSCSVSTIGSS
jgi:hypothetical protein